MNLRLTTLILLLATGLSAQHTISGRLLEASSGAPLEYATVLAKGNADQELITGVTSESGGLFSLETPHQDVFLEISFIGYETMRVDDLTFSANRAELGDIALGACLLYTSPSPRDATLSRMPSSA